MKKGTSSLNGILFWVGLVIAFFAAGNDSSSGAILGVGMLLAGVIDQGFAHISSAVAKDDVADTAGEHPKE
jgi:hypothetical protein